MKELENVWVETSIDIDTFDWKGNPIHLKGVPAIKNSKTNKVRVYASEVSKAEIKLLAERYDLEPRDIALLLLIYAKPGIFKGGEVHYKYHLNKMLFYLWKNLEKQYLGEAFPRDEFEPARKGPIPKTLGKDLERLAEKGLLTLSWYQWGKGPKDASLKTELTPSSERIAEKLWYQIADTFRETILYTKEQIFPLDPETIKKKVHREYPEYQKTYTELDRE